MDSESLHCKHPKKIKSSKDKHEVFVIPPDLLKKLGISIGNINGSPVIPDNADNGTPSTEIINNELIENIQASNCNQKSSETSILETASLMKKSVFLSPTFVPTIGNAIPGEVEISSKKSTDDSFAVTDFVELQDSVFVYADCNEVTDLLRNSNDTQKECSKVEHNIILNGEQTSLSDIIEGYPCMSPDGNKKQVVDINMTFDENLSEVGSKVDDVCNDDHSKSNNNVEFVLSSTDRDSTCVSFNDDNNDIHAPKQCKIKMISEETIPLSKLREIKRLQLSNVKNLTPVTVQSIIDTKFSNENKNSGLPSTMEPNSTVPLEYIMLHSDLDEVKNGENTNQSNFKFIESNEYIETIAVPSVTTSKGVEKARSEITSNTSVNLLEDERNLKGNGDNKTLFCESSDKDSKHLNENNTNKAIDDCVLNDHNRTSEDDISANDATDTDFDSTEKVIAVDVDKSIRTCNGKLDEGTKSEVEHINNHHITENDYECIKNYAEIHSPINNESGIEKDSIFKEKLKQKSDYKSKSKESRKSKTTRDKDSRAKKKIEHKISSENVEDKTGHDELASILNATKKLSSSVTDIKVDKVKEIAAYLRKFSHIYTDKKKTKTALSNDVNKRETIDSKTNTIESKLCIQGVEKPGGNEVGREHTGECKVLKTYARRNPTIKSKISTHNILPRSETCNTVDVLDQKLDAVNVLESCEIQEFCLCSDFGRFDYYDCDDLYEHIHFWHHKTANCELDLIFAIYSDEAIVSNSERELEQEEKTEDKIEAYDVCWNIFRSKFSENLDNSDTELMGYNTYAIDRLKDASGNGTQVSVSNDVAQKGDDGIVSKTHDRVLMKNNSNSDIILETIEHDVVDTAESKNSDNIKNIEKPLNSNDNNSAANSGHMNTDLSTSQPELTPSSVSKTSLSERSNVLDKAFIEGSDAKEKTYQRKQSIGNAKKFPRKEVKLDSPKIIEKPATKRSWSEKMTPASLKNNDEPSFKKSIKCGICHNIFSEVDWEDHVANQHHLIAWRVGGSINLDDPELAHKLKEILKNEGVLKCSICNMQLKKFNRFIDHIKYCVQKKLLNTDKTSNKPTRKSRTAIDDNVTCGVCQRTMLSYNWFEHIGRNHNYLAWKQGQDALNLDDEAVVWLHLQNIIRLDGKLTCYKCGLKRSRVKLYLAHIKTCDGSRVSLDESSASVDLNSSSIPEDQNVEEPAESSTVKCGVCKQDVTHSEWIEHISKEHNYLAWQDGDTPLDLEEEEEVWNHLQQFIRQNGGLTCHKCGLVRKRVKLYLTHVKTCDGTNSQVDNSSHNISLNATSKSADLNTTAKSTDECFEVPVINEESKIVKCGVCSEEVPILEWIQHIGKKHEYLAWQEGSTPLDLENELAVKVHLLDVSKQSGGLVCNKCEKRMKYPKTYQQHLKECTGVTVSPDSSKLDNSTSSWIESLFSKEKIKNEILTCGVCANKIESDEWINHIEAKHQYLAWAEGQPPLNVEDAAMVQQHLNDVSKMVGGLLCTKCGLKRKYVKSYLQHVETCQGKVNSGDLPFTLKSKDVIECAVCAATMEPKDWRKHAMKKHYNIAWVVGDNPIEINNPYAVESYLKEYQQAHNKLVCKVCGISRVSYVGFYAHIIICGKTEEETEIYKSVCDICQNKYLRIYKSQHMTMHREKELAMERKLLAAKEKELKKEEEPVEVVIQTGRRKAAEKAKNVIEKYKNSFHDGSYHCSKCGFNSDIEKELSDHVCVENKWGDVTDSDESVKLESCSDDDSDESDIDSNVSDEEREAREQASNKKKKYSDSISPKICRLPYQVNSVSTYMKRSTEEFIEKYLTDKDIFPQWHNCEFEEVSENEVVNYMPPIEESCKVRFDDDQDWVTFNRFESNKVKDTIVMFMGASIQCMSWAPALATRAGCEGEAQYLAAVTHRHDDAPRLAWDTTPTQHGLIQIWDCGNFMTSTPQFAFGIAHDFGTVWSIDWCPSGARDVFDLVPEPNNMQRLGLLAAACSNGSAYIFLVPHPTSITEKTKPFLKVKPVVELRLTSNENRKVYQATAIKWSVQKGHSDVVVGYADGTTAHYDLNGESPLLRSTENNRTVFYPYHDERVQNACIEDVAMYPGGAGGAGGVVCVGSAGGAGAGPLQSHVAAARVLYPPHWPAALLVGDDCLVNQSINELEWWGGGRRLGGARAAAGCAWCARVAAAAPPLLRVLRLHPAATDINKQVIGKIQMIPFGNKRKRQNDELAMIVEPITYSDAVKKYGIEFKQISATDRTTQQKLSAMPRDTYPERFPLSDVAAMQFCPTIKHHQKLAIAMHSGLIFIINV